MILQDAGRGCVSVTWLTSSSIATLLKQNITTEFFKAHRIEQVTIDGEECFLTPVKKFVRYLKGVYTSEKPLPTVESSLPADKPLPFSLAKIEGKEVNSDEFTSRPWATATVADRRKGRIFQHIEIVASADLQIKQYILRK